eukprot:scpid111589/ scgid14605/ 
MCLDQESLCVSDAMVALLDWSMCLDQESPLSPFFFLCTFTDESKPAMPDTTPCSLCRHFNELSLTYAIPLRCHCTVACLLVWCSFCFLHGNADAAHLMHYFSCVVWCCDPAHGHPSS